MNKYDAVIIDSGVDTGHPCFAGCRERITGIALTGSNGEYELVKSTADNIGHGTAVCSIIAGNSDADMLVINVMGKENEEVFEDALLYVLNYIYEEIECRVINISLGVNVSDDAEAISRVCCKLAEKGIIIVSAFDNSGAISYPAALDNVIGVDEGTDIKSEDAFEYFENSLVNIRTKAMYRRLPWKDRTYAMNSGISFSCAAISAKILCAKEAANFKTACEFLKATAAKVYAVSKYSIPKMPFKISVAVVFPVNKEIHSLIRYMERLEFEISGFYDIKYSGKVGKKLKRIVNGYESEACVMNIEDLDWNDGFDTVILGHTGELGSVTKLDFHKDILEKCRQYGKQLYSFDSYADECTPEEKKMIYWPEVSSENVPYDTLGKLYLYRKPILGVFGTSSVQGKFTLQMALRNTFTDKGYKVGQLGTEPSALLYGMDAVFPIGYNSTVRISDYDSILYVNRIIHDIEEKNVDIIIVGCQSGTIQYAPNNLSLFYLQQYNFLVATQPDCVILCINAFDKAEYIERTVKFIEGATEGKVIALAYIKNNVMYKKYANKADGETDLSLKEDMERRFGIPVFEIGNKEDNDRLVEAVEGFFAE